MPDGVGYTGEGMDGKMCAVVGAVPGAATVQGAAYLEVKYGFVREHLWR
jgi:hypothetical protein